jgi:hypothetical protein
MLQGRLSRRCGFREMMLFSNGEVQAMHSASPRSAPAVIACLACLAWLGLLNHLVAQEKTEMSPGPIPPEQFEKVLKLIKPQPGELRFHEIPWLIDVWEARREAAKEGKPILVWSGAGGAPIGVC